ncbi:hypothetical protein [Bernardetia sp.]|uniref:hypothetical protein n=1 Tax=Bernardetia sp. TaxID=1937974 RepID=UPI0025C04CEA|nr:hypothetical protein [Bernardetia sp.]
MNKNYILYLSFVFALLFLSSCESGEDDITDVDEQEDVCSEPKCYIRSLNTPAFSIKNNYEYLTLNGKKLLKTIVSDDGSEIQITYDDENRKIKEEHYIRNFPNVAREYNYLYDGDRVSSIEVYDKNTLPVTDETYNYIYNDREQLVQISSLDYSISFSYDNKGRVTQSEDSFGDKVIFSYQNCNEASNKYIGGVQQGEWVLFSSLDLVINLNCGQCPFDEVKVITEDGNEVIYKTTLTSDGLPIRIDIAEDGESYFVEIEYECE